MARPIADQVVVITDAAAGIGRETALEFACRRADLVLAAHEEEPLQSLRAEVERLGGRAVVVPTDVSDFDQMTVLASRAVQRFGRIDTWVNCASVSTNGTVEQMGVGEIHRALEVSLMGQIHGMKAALQHLRHSGGTIINVSSALAKRGVARQAAYSAAAHGVVAFGEALRLELRTDRVPVHVVDVLPSALRVPGGSTIGMPPVYEARVVAEAIVGAAERPVRQVFAGGAGRLLDIAQRISPAMVDRYLLGPGRMADRRMSDELDGRSKSTSLYTRWLGLHPARGRLAAALTLAAATVVARRAGTHR